METSTNTDTASKRIILSPVSQSGFTAAQYCLRILAAITTLASACIMFNSGESKLVYGFHLNARYTYSPAFKFYTYMNVIACVLSLLSLLPVFRLDRKFSSSINYFYLFIHDLVVLTLMVAACGGATAIGMVGKYGNKHAMWMTICNHFGKFCTKVSISLALSYLSTLCYLLLTIISANKSRKIPV